jgi:hypothetical protein
MADCFSALLVDDMAIKFYRRWLDQAQKEQPTTTPDEQQKTVRYNLSRVYERKGFTELALKELQFIYEHDMRFRDVALKIPVLYDKKMQEEQAISDQEQRVAASAPNPKLSRPSEGQIRCPKCLNPISNQVVYCPFCSCKVGFTETELEEQAARRKARLGVDENPALPGGPSPETGGEVT